MSRPVWPETLVATVITAGMVSCLVLSGLALARMIVPEWNGTYLLTFCVLTVVEGFISYRLYRQRALYVTGGTRYRLIELALLFVIFEVTSDVVEGYPILERGFVNLRLSALLLFIVIFITWQTATDTARDLDTIRREEATVRATENLASGDTVRDSMQFVSPAVRGLTYRFFAGGILLFVLAGLSQAENAQYLHVSRPDLTGPLLNVLVYFGLGMVMLALLRYATLSIMWAIAGNVLSPRLTGTWFRYGVAFLGVLAVFAFLLPTSYGTELLGAARGVLEQLLSSFGSWLAGLMSHIGLTPQTHPSQPPPSLRHPPPGLHPPRGLKPTKQQPLNLDWLFIVRALLFWAAVAALGAYFMRGYLAARRGRGGPAGPAFLRRLLGWIDRVWSALQRRARRYAEAALDLLPRREPAIAQHVPSLPARLRLSRMSARERIVYYFMSIVQRLERQGRRSPSQTALEMEAQVGPSLADAQGDMRSLTEAYLEARYSAHAVGGEEAERAKGNWERVRAALRRRDRGSDGAQGENG